MYRYKNNISVFTVYYTSGIYTSIYIYTVFIYSIHGGRGLAVQSFFWCRSLGDPGRALTRLDAIFIHVCDLGASTCGLGPGRGPRGPTPSLVLWPWLGDPLAASRRNRQRGASVYFPNFMSSYSCREENKENVRNP